MWLWMPRPRQKLACSGKDSFSTLCRIRSLKTQRRILLRSVRASDSWRVLGISHFEDRHTYRLELIGRPDTGAPYSDNQLVDDIN